MTSEISLEYGDVIKAYQSKSGELLTQLITAEAKLNASANIISKLNEKILQLEEENQKLQKSSSRSKKQSTDIVTDYN
jgi:predicted nuclease with TOPRIM domain